MARGWQCQSIYLEVRESEIQFPAMEKSEALSKQSHIQPLVETKGLLVMHLTVSLLDIILQKQFVIYCRLKYLTKFEYDEGQRSDPCSVKSVTDVWTYTRDLTPFCLFLQEPWKVRTQSILLRTGWVDCASLPIMHFSTSPLFGKEHHNLHGSVSIVFFCTVTDELCIKSFRHLIKSIVKSKTTLHSEFGWELYN